MKSLVLRIYMWTGPKSLVMLAALRGFYLKLHANMQLRWLGSTQVSHTLKAQPCDGGR